MNLELLSTDFEKVSYLQNILTDRATGSSPSDSEFQQLRYELLSNQKFSQYMPQWLKVHRNLNSFWNFIKKEYNSYQSRREFLANEFAPILNFLEFGQPPQQSPPSQQTFPTSQKASPPLTPQWPEPSKKIKTEVFIVHGHDNSAKQEVARFIEKIGLNAIILHEKASSGMTIIEKIEHYSSNADFAIVLYTPCDLGRLATDTKVQPKSRARQNVIFEHGYLMAKLGRKNVCALVKGDIETPNDISGVVYVQLDNAGAWKMELIKELKACDYNVTI
nr:nucleotide-binding protein [uncultured Desulfobacter sp.]